MQQVVGEVSQSFSAVTSALGNSARSQLLNPLPSAPTALSRQKSRPSNLRMTSSKQSLEEQVPTSKQESEKQEHEPQSDRPRQQHQFQPQEQSDGQKIEQVAEPFRIKANVFELQEYQFQGVDVGKIFLDFQQCSTHLMN